jgi:hypothetical protein
LAAEWVRVTDQAREGGREGGRGASHGPLPRDRALWLRHRARPKGGLGLTVTIDWRRPA